MAGVANLQRDFPSAVPAMPRYTAPVLSLLAVALLAVGSDAAALSRRDQASIDALTQRMQAAEQRYREALVKIGNNDPAGTAEGDAALEDMEDVIAACIQQKGCSVPTMLATYKRLLKLNADAEAEAAELAMTESSGPTIAT